MRRILMALATALAVCSYAMKASADAVISLNSGTTQTIYQGEIGTIVISASNIGDESIDIASLALGIQIVADGSPAGDLTISGVSAPENSVWLNGSTSGPDSASLANGDLNGTSGYFALTVFGDPDESGLYGIIPVGGSVDLATISFTADATAFGTWKFFVVNEENSSNLTVSNFLNGNFATVQFSNATAPSYSASPNTGVSFQVGTVIVVPEPSSLALAGLGCALAGFAVFNRRQPS